MPVHSNFALTLDVDWAPDCAIDYVAQILIERNVKATWFVTHRSEAIEKLEEHSDLFELGIHPNFLDGSTHGKSEDEVLAHIKEIVPNAITMRTHGLYQSTSFLIKANVKYGIDIDVSLFLPRAPNLIPHLIQWHGAKLWRIPYFWEDDSEMFEDHSLWNLLDEKLCVPGMKIFDFHPIHIALNSNKFSLYNDLKQIKPLKDWSLDFINAHTNKSSGARTTFLELTEKLSGRGKKIKEIVNIQ